MAASRESIVEYMKLPEGDMTNLFWILGGALVLIVAAVLLRHRMEFRERGCRREAASFRPAAVISELARLGPRSADITVVRDVEGTDIEAPAGRAPLLKRAGALVHKKDR